MAGLNLSDRRDRPGRNSDAARSRLRAVQNWYIPGLLAAFTAFCLGPSLLGFRTLLSVNVLTGGLPWAAYGTDTAGHQACTTDTVDSEMTGISYFRNQLFHGHFAGWQDIVVGGGPLGSVPNLGLLDPLSLPYFVLPLWLAPAFVKLLELAVAVGGTYLFLRRLNLGRPAATLAGFVFATSGFMVMWSNWPQTRVAAWIPALFWAAERLVQRRRASDVAIIAIIIGSMLFGGFPAVTGWALYFAGIYLAVRVIALYRTQLRTAATTIGMAAGGLVLGGMLSLFQMLPFLSQYQSTDLSYRQSRGTIGLPFSGLLTLVVPDARGLCIVGGLSTPGPNPIELVGYVGAAAAVLAVTGMAVGFARRRPFERGIWTYLVATTVFLVVLVYCSPRLREVVAHLPVFSNNAAARLRIMIGFLVAVLAGLGFERMIRDRDPSTLEPGRRQRRIGWGVLIWLVVGILALAVLWKARQAAITGKFLNSLERMLVAPGLMGIVAILLVAAAVGGVLLVGRSRQVSAKTLAFWVLPVLVVAQGASFFHTVLPGDDPDNFYPKTPAHRFLAKNLGMDRFASADNLLYPATSLYYGLRTPTGHAFTETAWKDLLKRVDPKVMRSATISAFSSKNLNQNTIGNAPILDQLAVKYFAVGPTQIAGNVAPVPPGDGQVSAAGATCTLPAQALRGVTVSLAALLPAASSRGVTVNVTARSGGKTVTSARYLGTAGSGRGPLSIAVPGESLGGGGPIAITLSASGASAPLVLAAQGGGIACAAITPKDDNLRLVHADAGTIIYQRLTALPRIRWASTTTVITDQDARLNALAQGLPAGRVVLDEAGPAASGQPGTVTVRDERGGAISADVNARGAGYLVVADALQQPGWSATVDGKRVDLLDADHAVVAIPVPAGQHHIAVHYNPPRQKAGAVGTLIAIVIVIGLFAWEWRRRRKDGQRSAVVSAERPDDTAVLDVSNVPEAPDVGDVPLGTPR